MSHLSPVTLLAMTARFGGIRSPRHPVILAASACFVVAGLWIATTSLILVDGSIEVVTVVPQGNESSPAERQPVVPGPTRMDIGPGAFASDAKGVIATPVGKPDRPMRRS